MSEVAMLEPTSDELAFASELGRMLTTSWPLATSRAVLEGPEEHAPSSWDALARLGLPGLLVPEARGGSGAGASVVVLAGIELGKVLLPSPFWVSSIVSTALLRDVVPDSPVHTALADGRSIATMAFLDARGDWSPAGLGMTCTDGRTVTGEAPFVHQASSADLLLVVTAQGPDLFLVDLRAARERVAITPLRCVDTSRPVSRVALHQAPATRLASGPAVAEAVARAEHWAVVGQLAEGLGAAEAGLRLSVEHVSTRVQFGRVVGSFQAVKHRCADLFARVESVRSVLYHAAAVLDDPSSTPAALTGATSLAAAYASERLLSCAADTIQLHGGMGFTWEHDAHLYFRRAEADAALLGDAVTHRSRLAALLGLIRTDDATSAAPILEETA
jgi:alkylation response protein AidB-like acyl-CoA dehydrogenase